MKDITLTFIDGKVIVTPVVPSELRSELTYWHRSMRYDPEKHARVVAGEYRQLYHHTTSIDKKGVMQEKLIAPIGLSKRIYDTLLKLGNWITIDDKRTLLPKPHPDKVNVPLRSYQIDGYSAMISNMGGIMACPTGWGKSYLQAAIIDTFDREELKIRGTPITVLTAPDKDIVNQLYEGLIDIFKDTDREVGVLHSDANKKSDDIVVITLDSLQRVNADEVGLLLIDEVHTAATDSRIPKLLAMDKAVKWGFSATPVGRFDGGDVTTEALVGPQVYNRTYLDGVKDGALVPITVFWVKAPEPAMGADNLHKYKRKDTQTKYGLIRNAPLTNMIADLITRVPDSMQTLCIMQLLEHMNELVSVLPDIRYVHGTKYKKGLSPATHSFISPITTKERIAIYNEFKSGDIRKILSTTIYQQGVNFPQLEVLINVGGGGSDIAAGQIPGRASRNIKGKDCSYIVDIWNSWNVYRDNLGRLKNGKLHTDDKSRKKTYEKLGFNQVWVDSIEELPFIPEEVQ